LLTAEYLFQKVHAEGILQLHITGSSACFAVAAVRVLLFNLLIEDRENYGCLNRFSGRYGSKLRVVRSFFLCLILIAKQSVNPKAIRTTETSSLITSSSLNRNISVPGLCSISSL
jgi:hypothetical protein